jgi:hypothetical protein
VPEKARGKRNTVALARLAHVARDRAGLASGIEPMRLPIATHYGKGKFAGPESRPAALDEWIVVVAIGTRRYDDDVLVFSGFPAARAKRVPPPKAACDSWSGVFEGRL